MSVDSHTFLFLDEVLLRASILDVDLETLRTQETEPLQGLGVETNLRESVLPVRKA